MIWRMEEERREETSFKTGDDLLRQGNTATDPDDEVTVILTRVQRLYSYIGEK